MEQNKKGLKLDDNIDLNKRDVPYPMLYGGSHIEMFGNKKVSFEGKYKIIEYTTELFRIKRGKGSIIFIGSELTLSNVQADSFLLTGLISNIEFE